MASAALELMGFFLGLLGLLGTTVATGARMTTQTYHNPILQAGGENRLRTTSHSSQASAQAGQGGKKPAAGYDITGYV
ncbi:hypothetical protein KUCAC02_003131 [Chaenocephalus aceratus]|uniref:Uncharacterized protein n=1 Tax=Chaenocephalus aceratus TaxID=36190 RepID=A0ACB9WKS6_CHAAC|nr:hypothetical protein KUCAC02_003131 [Chaenocephalus aceratus]